ncbi:hypothetical protein IW16_24025 [Chryseobacterium vrystaatense]|uniref:Uncharacterized protein n=1 Tax=Chryseobacterium vrystaatense TaxID=307480 RepID=A0ABR4UG12_9FLAO|nr:hypothetical protein IW16_24025 [Chryseobacterium vrystaatense]
MELWNRTDFIHSFYLIQRWPKLVLKIPMNERIDKKIPFHKPGPVLKENTYFLKKGIFPLLSFA